MMIDSQCLYSADDRPCKRCSTAGKSCGPKTLARENDANARHHADLHKSTLSTSGPTAPAPPPVGSTHHRAPLWSAQKPLLPKILEYVGVRDISEVADRLSHELSVLHAIVAANPFFRPPFESTRDILARLPPIMQDGGQEQIPGISSMQQQQQQQHQQQQHQHQQHQQQHQQQQGDVTGFLSVQRNLRAVSLPPNPELVHSRPSSGMSGDGSHHGEEKNHERKGPMIELPRIKVESRQESQLDKRAPGDGLPQFQPFWYLLPRIPPLYHF
jgi:hypothetical protein